MKIALIHPILDFRGGAEKLVLYLANELQKRGEGVDIYSISYNEDRCYPEINKNLNVHSLMRNFSYPSAKSRLLLPYEFLLKIFYANKLVGKIEKRYDVINCHNFPATITAVKAGEKNNTPVAWFCHEPLDVVRSNSLMLRFIKNYDRRIVEKINRIVTYNYNVDSIKKLYNTTPLETYAGIDIERFEGSNGNRIKEKYEITGDVLLFVGQLIEDKRVQDLIKALEIIKKQIPDVKLIVVGDGRYKENLMKLAKKLNLEENIIFTGFVEEEELPDYYACADIFLNPAIKQSWGLAPFEAMAAGVPVIVSSDTGAAKVIEEKDIGVVMEPLEPDAWASGIVELLENREGLESMTRKGEMWVKENMSWEIFAERMLNIFKKMM
jgi:glycosyltransferase involved in cell wall biosynthesis